MTEKVVWYCLIAITLLSCRTISAPVIHDEPAGGAHRELEHWESSSNDRCGECHTQEMAGFFASAHARGLRSARFRAEWMPDRSEFCSNCHAPLGRPGTVGAAQAIGCIACHTSRRSSPLPLDDQLCATCHQFGFPTAQQVPNSPYPASTPLQSTWEEWRRTDAARSGRGCIACHMSPNSGGHQMAVGASATPVIDVGVQWRGDTLRVEIEATDAVGHSVPTGDVFRGLVVEAIVSGETRVREVLSRRFVAYIDEHGQTRMNEGFDARIPPPGTGSRIVELSGLEEEHTIVLEIAVVRSVVDSEQTTRSSDNRRVIWTGEVTPR